MATGINNDGQIVGFTRSSGVTSGFLLSNGNHLTRFQFGGRDTYATGINDKDQIVGWYLDRSGMHGFVFSDPTGPASVRSINDPNGIGSTVVNGINDKGDLVGFYTDSSRNTDGFLAK